MDTTSGHWASGSWQVTRGKADEFINRWREFLEWTHAAHPDLEWARLVRDVDDDHHFVSFASWANAGGSGGVEAVAGVRRASRCLPHAL